MELIILLKGYKMENQKLFITDNRQYGDQYQSHLFEQYKLYVESAEKISDRRQNSNNFFISINAALITILGISFQIEALGGLTWVRLSIVLVGIIICIIFWFLLRSYKQLNSGKFKVIHEIEKNLPMALYEYEWNLLGGGKNKKLYYPFSHIELYIPWAFGIFYLVLGVILLALA